MRQTEISGLRENGLCQWRRAWFLSSAQYSASSLGTVMNVDRCGMGSGAVETAWSEVIHGRGGISEIRVIRENSHGFKISGSLDLDAFCNKL